MHITLVLIDLFIEDDCSVNLNSLGMLDKNKLLQFDWICLYYG